MKNYKKISIKVLHETKWLCYNGTMLKTKTKVATGIVGIALVFSVFAFNILLSDSSSACSTSPCNTTFEVNVKESLAVTVSTDYSEGTGDVDQFLRNKISLSVATNNASGFAASMYPSNYSTTNAPLVNAIDSSKTIPTWTGSTGYVCGGSSACSNFPVNKWGYSLNDNSSYAGTYYAMTGTSASPTTIITGTGSGSKDIYFGAKADINQASGAYLGTVVISVVSGSTTPSTPSNPANPNDDNPTDTSGQSPATYDENNQRTVYTTVSSTGSGSSTVTTTTTQVTPGDTTSMYAPAQGESKYTESNISNGSQIATGLAVASAAAAASGMIFFILAKRRDDDDDEEEPQA